MSKVTWSLLAFCLLSAGAAIGLGVYATDQHDEAVRERVKRETCILAMQRNTGALQRLCDTRVEVCIDGKRAELNRCRSECAERVKSEALAVELTEDTGRLIEELRGVLGYSP